jgi:hypothetical protein
MVNSEAHRKLALAIRLVATVKPDFSSACSIEVESDVGIFKAANIATNCYRTDSTNSEPPSSLPCCRRGD